MFKENTLNLFPSESQLTWKDVPKCKYCSQLFTVYKKNNESRRAILLPCGHNICEKCYYNTCYQTIKCFDCNSEIILHSRLHKRRELANYNYFLIGKIYALTNTKVEIPADVNQLNQQACSLCNADTTYKCIECDDIFCLSCFQRNHLTNKEIQRHSLTRISIDAIDRVIFNVKCKTHGDCDLQYYCNDCAHAICSKCIPLHTNHIFKILIAQNCEKEAELLTLCDSFKEALKFNENSIKDVKRSRDSHIYHKSKTINDISSFFLYYHGILQHIENNLLKNIEETSNQFIDAIDTVNTELLDSEKLLNEYLVKLSKFSEKIPEAYDISDAINKGNSALATIGCLTEFSNIDDNPYSFKEINLPTKRAIKSLFQFDIKGDFNLPDVKTFFERDTNYLKYNLVEKKTLINKASVSKLEPNKNQNTIMKGELNVFKNNIQNEAVHVTHIKNPLMFYIQTKANNVLVEQINNYCFNERKQIIKAESIKQNNIYMIHNPSDNKWYRVKAVKTLNNDMYEVMYIDFGNRDKVESKRLCELTNDLKKHPICVKKCSLYNIKPTKTWTNEINQLMVDIVANKIVRMLIFDVINDVHYVDLITLNHDYPVSIRDALLFSELIKNDQKIACTHLYLFNKTKESLTKYSNKMFSIYTFNQEEFLNVKILNIVSPTNFYIIKKSDIESLNAMMLLFNEKYNNKYFADKLRLYFPKENIVCAVLLPCKMYVKDDDEATSESNDWTWYRAIILSIISKDACEVLTVDYGKKTIISSTYLYMLDDGFMKDNEYAINCALIDIRPANPINELWSSEAINDFINITKKNSIQLCVYKKMMKVFGVTMFIVKRRMDICVNALLVKLKHAVSTGFESRLMNYRKNPLASGSENSRNLKMPCDIIERRLSVPKESQPKRNYLKIFITNIISPSEFYIYLVKHLSGINKMQIEIQKYMLNEKVHERICDAPVINEKYLGFTTRNSQENDMENNPVKQFYRIRIIEDLNNDKYKVLLCDFGVIKGINKNDIYLINNKNIENVCDGIIKCTLSHIKPTGGLPTWLQTSIDSFNIIVEKYDEFSITLDNAVNFHNDAKSANALSVILWGLQEKTNDALKPHIDNWININKILVNRGVVHPMKKFDDMLEPNFDLELFNIDFSITNLSYQSCSNNDVNVANEIEELENDLPIQELLNDDITEINKWLPAKPFEKTIFTAIPTYVTNTGIIFLHDTNQIPLINGITKILQEKYENMSNESNDNSTFKRHQPCIVRYHGDNYFYRGMIIKKYYKKKTLHFHVLFVDFGNIEKCKLNDLHVEVILGKIPIQTYKYYLNDIKPINKNNKFDRAAVDYIHRLIVDKQCSIRITNLLSKPEQKIKKCEITVGKLNLNELLIQNKYAIKDPYYDFNQMKLDKYDYYESGDNRENIDTDSENNDNKLKDILCVISESNKESNVCGNTGPDNDIVDLNVREDNDIKQLIRNLSIKDFIKELNDDNSDFFEAHENKEDDFYLFNPLDIDTSTKINEPIDKKKKTI